MDDATPFICDQSLENMLKCFEKLALRWFESTCCFQVVSMNKFGQRKGKTQCGKILVLLLGSFSEIDKYVSELCSKKNVQLSL